MGSVPREAQHKWDVGSNCSRGQDRRVPVRQGNNAFSGTGQRR